MNNPTLEQITAELQRELDVRNKVYPRWIEEGKITDKRANHRCACLILAINLIQESIPPQHPKAIEAVIDELQRELRFRRKVYPDWKLAERISPEDAQHRVACFELAISELSKKLPQQITLGI